MAAHPLASLFRAHAPALPDAAPEALEAALEEIHRRGRVAWPDLALPAPVLVQHVAERVRAAPGEDLLRALRALHAEDLYLACACLNGVGGALGAFERYGFAQLPAQLAHVAPTPTLLDEVGQVLRQTLF